MVIVGIKSWFCSHFIDGLIPSADIDYMSFFFFCAFWSKSHFISGGYLHGVNSLTFGVDIERIRWMGILQVCYTSHSIFFFYPMFHTRVIGRSKLPSIMCLLRVKGAISSQKVFIWKTSTLCFCKRSYMLLALFLQFRLKSLFDLL